MTTQTVLQNKPTLIDVGHSRISHWRIGRGPDVLFIHGWPLHAATFRDLVPLLADRFTCHVIDLPGCGQSEWSGDSKFGLRDHAASLRRVVDQLGLTRYGIIAHDSGAVIARLLAAADERVAALVLGNSEIPGHRPWQVELFVTLAKLRIDRLAMLPVLGIPWLRRSSLGYKGCFQDLRHLEGEFGRLFVAPLLRSRRVAAGQRQLLLHFDWSLIDTLADVHKRIRAPVNLVWGADDPFFPLPKARAMVSQFGGGASLSVLSPGKLFVHDEFPAAFADAARPFLAEQLSTSAQVIAS